MKKQNTISLKKAKKWAKEWRDDEALTTNTLNVEPLIYQK